jgi:hypothetical protein
MFWKMGEDSSREGGGLKSIEAEPRPFIPSFPTSKMRARHCYGQLVVSRLCL